MKKQVFDVMDTNLCILNIDLIITNTKKGTRCLLDDICLPYNEALLLKKDFQNKTLAEWVQIYEKIVINKPITKKTIDNRKNHHKK